MKTIALKGTVITSTGASIEIHGTTMGTKMELTFSDTCFIKYVFNCFKSRICFYCSIDFE